MNLVLHKDNTFKVIRNWTAYSFAPTTFYDISVDGEVNEYSLSHGSKKDKETFHYNWIQPISNFEPDNIEEMLLTKGRYSSFVDKFFGKKS